MIAVLQKLGKAVGIIPPAVYPCGDVRRVNLGIRGRHRESAAVCKQDMFKARQAYPQTFSGAYPAGLLLYHATVNCRSLWLTRRG